jgi:hypothetical protein
LAKPGIAANLSFGYKLNKSVAIILMLGGSQNKQDAKAYENYLKQQFGNAATTTVTAGSWKIGSIMAGASKALALKKMESFL